MNARIRRKLGVGCSAPRHAARERAMIPAGMRDAAALSGLEDVAAMSSPERSAPLSSSPRSTTARWRTGATLPPISVSPRAPSRAVRSSVTRASAKRETGRHAPSPYRARLMLAALPAWKRARVLVPRGLRPAERPAGAQGRHRRSRPQAGHCVVALRRGGCRAGRRGSEDALTRSRVRLLTSGRK